MALTLEQLVGQRLLWSFNGKTEPSADFLSALKSGHVSGVSLFRALNIDHPAQVRQLIDQLQSIASEAGLPVLLIAADQEGGQLIGLGEHTTPFPGNMALGATRSVDLARRVGYAIGREAAAMGVNVNYAPVCDVNINPRNPVIGTRSFGESPELVSTLAAALLRGEADIVEGLTPEETARRFFLLFTTRPAGAKFKEGGARFPLEKNSDGYTGRIEGPENTFLEGNPPMALPLEIRPEPGGKRARVRDWPAAAPLACRRYCEEPKATRQSGAASRLRTASLRAQ